MCVEKSPPFREGRGLLPSVAFLPKNEGSNQLSDKSFPTSGLLFVDGSNNRKKEQVGPQEQVLWNKNMTLKPLTACYQSAHDLPTV